MMSALKEMLKNAWLLKQISAEQYLRVCEIKPAKGETIPPGRELTAGEIGALMVTCKKDPSPAGVRDAAIIALGIAGVPHREEIAALDFEKFDPTTGSLIIFGKGNKERLTYIDNGALDALNDWISIRGSNPGPLFYPITRGGNLISRRMTNQAVYNLLQKSAKLAGVKAFSPHDLRRTFISNMLTAGADIATVAKVAGHSSVNTTARYDRRPEEAKQKAAGLLHVPYKPRYIK